MPKTITGEIKLSYIRQVFSDLRKYPNGKTCPFISGVIRFDSKGHFWIMNKPDDGFSEFGYPYDTMENLLKDWNVEITGLGKDQFSFFFKFSPRK